MVCKTRYKTAELRKYESAGLSSLSSEMGEKRLELDFKTHPSFPFPISSLNNHEPMDTEEIFFHWMDFGMRTNYILKEHYPIG